LVFVGARTQSFLIHSKQTPDPKHMGTSSPAQHPLGLDAITVTNVQGELVFSVIMAAGWFCEKYFFLKKKTGFNRQPL
jgi:hypothetical protein